MRARWHPPRSSKGFVLLHTLWLLLTASALMSGLLVLASRTSADFALAERETRRELAQESAAEFVIHDIVTRGARSRWLRPPSVSDEVDIDGQRIALSVQNVAGLVDAGSGDTQVLASLLSGTLETAGATVLARIDAARRRTGESARPFATYAELRAITHVPDPTFGCLYRHVTLFSGRTEPDPLLVTPGLATLLQLNRPESQPPSALEAEASPAGATYRIEAGLAPSGADPGGQVLSIEVTITGRLRPSHLIRSWQYRPRDAKEEDCS